MKISDEIRNDFLRNDDVGEVADRQLLCIADRIDRKMVELPKDAEGREIPLDTKVLYDIDGGKHEVNFYSFAPESGYWTVNIDMQSDSETHVTEGFHLHRPDSWEQLAEDLNRAWDVHGKRCREMPCHYDKDRGEKCNDCRLNSHGKMNCLDAMMADIVSRVNRLAKMGGTR